MTEGTSQGLFIVVAIVIFGIFVVMAYILFEDTLSPAMANMFTTATEHAEMNREISDNLVTTQDWTTWQNSASTGTVEIVEMTDEYIIFEATKHSIHGGIHFQNTIVEPNTKYALSYDITLLDGEVDRLGGHLKSNLSSKVYINQKYYRDEYHEGVPFTLTKGNPVHNKVIYTTNDEITDMDFVHIQPNREYTSKVSLLERYDKAYKVKVENIRFVKIR